MENELDAQNGLDERIDKRMDGKYSWKRTEDIEIDLVDLLRRLCGQWKQIAVCAAVFALVLGGYGWLKGKDAPAEDDIVKEAVLTEAEEQAVADAVRLESEIRGLETYLNSSVLMQLDPYHKNRQIMLYSISRAKRQELPVITESYLNFIGNGGAADALLDLENSQKLDKSCLAELISVYQKNYSSPDLVIADDAVESSQMMESVFYVEVTGRDAREAEKTALDVQKVLENYSDEVKKNAGSHRLKLVSDMGNVTADSGLQSQQHEKKAALSANMANLRTMTDSFSENQMAFYIEAARLEGGEEQESDVSTGEYASGRHMSSIMKYIFLGVMAGVFLYCGVYSCRYLLSGTVKSIEEMKRRYTFPIYSGITGSEAFANVKEQTLNRIRLVCKKRGITRLCAVSDIPLEGWEKEYLENLAGRLKSWEIDLSVAESWDDLEEVRNVLIVCGVGMTTHQMIDDEMNFYLENGISVTGAIVFL